MDGDPQDPEQSSSISPKMRIGYVSLNVSDIQKSLDFYQSLLGFKQTGSPSDKRAYLSGGGTKSPRLIELSEVRNRTDPGRRAGLYHLAILLPERRHLADMLVNLTERSGEVHFDGLADHLVSESIYIRDPDSIGIEIYRDRAFSEWKWNGDQVQMATLPLDVDGLLRDSTGKWKEMPQETRIGHVHLHVRNLARAGRFYRESLGLDQTAVFPGARFFSAGKYHHHVATNTWLGENILPADAKRVGLNHFGIELPNRKILEDTLQNLQSQGVMVRKHAVDDMPVDFAALEDQDGIAMWVYARGAGQTNRQDSSRPLLR